MWVKESVVIMHSILNQVIGFEDGYIRVNYSVVYSTPHYWYMDINSASLNLLWEKWTATNIFYSLSLCFSQWLRVWSRMKHSSVCMVLTCPELFNQFHSNLVSLNSDKFIRDSHYYGAELACECIFFSWFETPTLQRCLDIRFPLTKTMEYMVVNIDPNVLLPINLSILYIDMPWNPQKCFVTVFFEWALSTMDNLIMLEEMRYNCGKVYVWGLTYTLQKYSARKVRTFSIFFLYSLEYK